MDLDVALPPLLTVLLLPSLAEFIVVSGGVTSTFQVKSSGELSLFPELSSALTLNVWGPLLNKLGNVSGLVQSAKVELSKLHWKRFTSTLLVLTLLVSEPENVNVIELDLVLLPLDKVFLLLSTTELIDVVGGVVSIDQTKDAGEASTFATLSSALNSIVWAPSDRLLNCTGLVHVVNDAPSTEHSKWFTPVPLSVPEKAKVMEVDVVLPSVVTVFLLPSMADVIEVVGGAVSMVQLNETGDVPLFPALSSDNILNVWAPSFNKLGNVKGLVQVTKSELSVLHSKWSIPMPPVSLPENAKVMDVDLVVPALATALLLPSVAEFMEVFGGTVSTVQLNETGDEPLFPALSSDNTSKLWDLSSRLLNCTGLVHVENEAPSREHSKWSTPTPLSEPENVNIMILDVVLPPLVTVSFLPSNAVSILEDGRLVSTFQVKSSGELSLFPELSSALTLNVWGPSLKLGNVSGPVQSAKAESSKLHWKCFTSALLLSEPENVNVIEFDRVLLPLDKVFLLLSTIELIDVVGGVVSIDQTKEAGDTSEFATLSFALTFNVWAPSASWLYSTGLLQTANDAPSSEHSRWFTPVPLSVPEKAMVMDVDVVLPPVVAVFLLPSMAEVIDVVGGAVSMVQLNDEGVGSIFLTLSEAFISIIWTPSFNALSSSGALQVENDAPSSEHSKWLIPTPLPSLPPVSIPEKVIIAELEDELPPVTMELLFPSLKESIVVVGGTVSTVQLNEAGDVPLFPTLSSDNTLNVWLPSFIELGNVKGLVHVT
jgi:hypothetical protein